MVWFHWFTAGDEFNLRVNCLSSLSVSDLGDILMRLWVLDFKVDDGMNKGFWSCWDRMDMFYQ